MDQHLEVIIIFCLCALVPLWWRRKGREQPNIKPVHKGKSFCLMLRVSRWLLRGLLSLSFFLRLPSVQFFSTNERFVPIASFHTFPICLFVHYLYFLVSYPRRCHVVDLRTKHQDACGKQTENTDNHCSIASRLDQWKPHSACICNNCIMWNKWYPNACDAACHFMLIHAELKGWHSEKRARWHTSGEWTHGPDCFSVPFTASFLIPPLLAHI